MKTTLKYLGATVAAILLLAVLAGDGFAAETAHRRPGPGYGPPPPAHHYYGGHHGGYYRPGRPIPPPPPVWHGRPNYRPYHDYRPRYYAPIIVRPRPIVGIYL